MPRPWRQPSRISPAVISIGLGTRAPSSPSSVGSMTSLQVPHAAGEVEIGAGVGDLAAEARDQRVRLDARPVRLADEPDAGRTIHRLLPQLQREGAGKSGRVDSRLPFDAARADGEDDAADRPKRAGDPRRKSVSEVGAGPRVAIKVRTGGDTLVGGAGRRRLTGYWEQRDACLAGGRSVERAIVVYDLLADQRSPGHFRRRRRGRPVRQKRGDLRWSHLLDDHDATNELDDPRKTPDQLVAIQIDAPIIGRACPRFRVVEQQADA